MRLHLEYAEEDDTFEILGQYRVQAIVNVLSGIAIANMQLSYEVAVSGAMRWPAGFRPEVLIENETRMK